MKPVSVQKVSAVLKKAGFTRTDNDIWHPSEGYHIRGVRRTDVLRPGQDRINTDEIHIYHWGENSTTRSTAEALAKYQATLEAAGIEVRLTTDTPGTRHNDYLICTGIKEET